MELVTRADARARGLSRYFTGLACKRSHIAERLTRSGNCLACQAENNRAPAGIAQRAEWQKRPDNMEAARLRSSAYHRANREACLAKMRPRNARYYASNRERLIAAASAYVERNRDWRRQYVRAWQRLRLRSDPATAAAAAARKMVYRVLGLAGQKKSARTAEFLGYSARDLREHLESLFQPGMSWANHGEWHIDHRRPLASFDLTDAAQMLSANALSNLQPLWAMDNMKKAARWQPAEESGCGPG